MSPARTNRSSIPGGRAPTGLVFDETVDGPATVTMAPRNPDERKRVFRKPDGQALRPPRRLLARHELANLPGGHDAEQNAEPAQDDRRSGRDVEDERREQADDDARKPEHGRQDHRLAEGPRDLDARQSRKDEEGRDEQDAGDGDRDDDGHAGQGAEHVVEERGPDPRGLGLGFIERRVDELAEGKEHEREDRREDGGDEQELVRAREEDAPEQQALRADAEPPTQLIARDARGQAPRQGHGHGRVARDLRRAREFRDAHRAEDDEPRRGPQGEEPDVIPDGETAERRVGEAIADEGDVLEDDEDAQEGAEEGDQDSDEEGALDEPVGQLGKDLVERAHGFGITASGKSSRSICAGWRSKATGSPSKSRVVLRNAIRLASFVTLWTSWDVRTIVIPRSRFRCTNMR